MVWYSGVLNTRQRPLSSAQSPHDRVSTMTDQTPHECTGMESLQPTATIIHIYPEKRQLAVQNSSLELSQHSGEQYCVQWERPDLEELSELDFPQDDSVCTLLLKKIHLETLNNHQGLLVTVYLEMVGTSSSTLILGTDGLSNISSCSEFCMIIYAE